MDVEAGTPTDERRVVVVGPCASGKTTLVAGLRRLGYRAFACGQEHSDIPTLWRHGDPDVLIALTIDLSTLRRRRGPDWPEALFRVQQRRLAPAVAAADIVLDTSGSSAETVLARAEAALRRSVEDPAAAGSPGSGRAPRRPPGDRLAPVPPAAGDGDRGG